MSTRAPGSPPCARIAPRRTQGALCRDHSRCAGRVAGGRLHRGCRGPDRARRDPDASFGSASRKLERLIVTHRVVLVHPIAIERWLVRVDEDGQVLARRRSPKRGLAFDLFDELVHIPALIDHPNFRIEIPLIREEEIRGPIPEGVRYRYPRTWRRIDRRLLDVVDTCRIDTPAISRPAPGRSPGPVHDRRPGRGDPTFEAARSTCGLHAGAFRAVERLARDGRLVAFRRTTEATTRSRAGHDRIGPWQDVTSDPCRRTARRPSSGR